MKSKLLLLLFVSLSFFTQAQEKSYDNNVQYFIELNGTMGQYRVGGTQLMHLLKEQYKDAKVSDAHWLEAEKAIQQSLDGLKTDLVIVYKKFFTHDEIKELIKLYDNAVAQKYINNVISITEASQDASVVWSRSLYNQLIDLLHEKGYAQE